MKSILEKNLEKIKVLFVMKPTQLKYRGYSLKNAPTSTGRGDVVARFVVSTLKEPRGLNPDLGVLIFLNDEFRNELHPDPEKKSPEKAVLITSRANFFDSTKDSAKINQYSVLKAFYDSVEKQLIEGQHNYDLSLFTAISSADLRNLTELLEKKYFKIFLLYEDAKNEAFNHQNEINRNNKLAFFIGDQIGYKPADLEHLKQHSLLVNLGSTPYLATSVVEMLKYLIYSHNN